MRREMDRTISVSSATAVSARGVARSVSRVPRLNSTAAQTGVDAVDLLADAPRLLLGDPVQREDRVGRLLGDQPHHPLVGLGQLALVDVLAQRDVVVHALVEIIAVVGDRVGERRVERVEDAGEFVVGAAPALPQLLAFLLDRGEQCVAVRFGIEQFQADRHCGGVAVQQFGQRLRHERRRQPLLKFHQPGAALVEAVAAGLDRAAPRHEFLDLRPAFVGAGVERLDVGVARPSATRTARAAGRHARRRSRCRSGSTAGTARRSPCTPPPGRATAGAAAAMSSAVRRAFW